VVYSKPGKSDRALADFQKVVELKPDVAEAYFEMGYVYQQQQQYDEAILAYRQALQIHPDDAVVHHNLARCYIRQGNREAAERERKIAKQLQDDADEIDRAQAGIHQYPDQPERYAYLASLYQKRGKWEQAIQQYRLALTVNPRFMPAYHQLVEIYTRRREFDQAIQVYHDALKQMPEDILMRVRLALLYKERNRLKEAREQLDIAQALGETVKKGKMTPEELETLAFVYYAKGLYDEAEAALREAMAFDPNNPRYLRQLDAIRAARQRR
jgi:tetratricopeptide (TPR) repeat protein